jgi:hypothetical protein
MLRPHARLALAASLVALPAFGCANARQKDLDNPDTAAAYQDNRYKEDIVTGKESQTYEDKGSGISQKALMGIQDSMATVYQRDFERCLEGEMDRYGTRFLRTVFNVEFTIDTTGKVTNVNVISVGVREQNAAGADKGEKDAAGMKQCIIDSGMAWEFEPPPEIVYIHTYSGRVGEAY